MTRLASTLLSVVLICFILMYLKPVLVPFVFALMIYFLTNEIKYYLSRLSIVRATFPGWIANLISFLVIYGFITLLVVFVSNDLEQLSSKIPVYEQNISKVLASLNQYFGIDLFAYGLDYFKNLDLSGLVQGLLSFVTSLMGNVFLIILYVLFILAENSVTKQKIDKMFNASAQKERVLSILTKINRSISRYITLKTFVSIITGLLSYVVLLILNVDFAALWAVGIFVLNYIPTVGSIVATLFPAFMALIQFSDFSPFLWVLFLIGSIQLLVGNLIEPRVMGNNLNISPLVVLLSLAFGGLIWGIEGMILCVPIAVIVIIILAHFESTKKIAILLSEKGEV